jgi:hypothetical protein
MSRLTPWLRPGRPHPRPGDLIQHGHGGPRLTGQRVVGSVSEPGKAVTGVASTDLFTSAGHGYLIGDRVRFSGLTGGAGITAGLDLFVIASGFTANTFRVSTTKLGATIDVTTDLTAGTVSRRRDNYSTV